MAIRVKLCQQQLTGSARVYARAHGTRDGTRDDSAKGRNSVSTHGRFRAKLPSCICRRPA